MVERVVMALAELPQITRIVVMIETPSLLDALPALRALGARVRSLPAAASPSLSVAAALEQFGTPLLVTTADHALLRAEWLQYFLDHCPAGRDVRSEEHTSELQSLMRISYAVFCLKKKTTLTITSNTKTLTHESHTQNNKLK